ncbi:MAG: GYD domain-containing protein [Thermoproteota archaeon]
MSVFVVLGNWTDQGIKNVKEAPGRDKEAREMVENAGGSIQIFYTLGDYDFVAIIEIPKDEDLVSILLCLGSMGNVRTSTMKAWKESEVAEMLKAPHPTKRPML